MFVKLFGGLAVATGLFAAAIAGTSSNQHRESSLLQQQSESRLLLGRLLQGLPQLQLRLRLLRRLRKRL